MKAQIFVVIAIILLIGVGYYFYSKDSSEDISVDSDGSIEENGSTETDSGTAFEDTTENYEISGVYANPNLLGATEVNRSIDNYVGSFKIEANQAMTELKETESAISRYSLDINAKSFVGTQYVFHVVTISEYTGGANSNVVIQTFAYKVSDQSLVTLSEFVIEAKREDFVGQVKNALFELKDDETNGSGIFEDVIEELTFEDLKTFYVSDTAVVVIFSKYEVAPGAAGVLFIEIPLNEI